MKKAFKAIKESLDLFKSYPLIVLPFVFYALLEAMVLYLLFLAPQDPFAKLLAPPIRRFIGAEFVIYPLNLYKLPLLFSYAKIALSLMPGIFITAFLVGRTHSIRFGHDESRRFYFMTVFSRFFSLLFIWSLNIAVIKLLGPLFRQVISFGDSKTYLTFLQYSFYFIAYFVQITFLYMIPLVILAKKSFLRALITNFRYLIRLFVPTTVLILISALFYLGIYVLETNIPRLMVNTFPEISVIVLAAGIPFTFLINVFIVMTTTVLFINEEENDLN